MIIDLILDRKDNEQLIAKGHTHYILIGIAKTLHEGEFIEEGCTHIPLAYNPLRFYQRVRDYGEIGWDILRAMDGGTEEDVKRELCNGIYDFIEQ